MLYFWENEVAKAYTYRHKERRQQQNLYNSVVAAFFYMLYLVFRGIFLKFLAE